MSKTSLTTIDLEPEESWIKAYFRYLIDEYQYRYDGFSDGYFIFTGKKAMIQILPGRAVPSIFVTKIGEPRRVLINWIIKYFEGAWPYANVDFTIKPLKENLKFFSKVLREYIPKISHEIDNWWLPVNKFVYKKLEQDYSDEGQISDFLSSYKEFHDYLESKGAI
jgi:hypothetical protein